MSDAIADDVYLSINGPGSGPSVALRERLGPAVRSMLTSDSPGQGGRTPKQATAAVKLA
jgi:hypothetical protein